MKYVFIKKHQAEFSIKAMCRVLRVARSGWYAWRIRRCQINSRQQFRFVCDDAVRTAFAEAKQHYDCGSRISSLATGTRSGLAVVIDQWSRAVIGWSISSRITTKLACDALPMTLWRRKRPKHVIVHTDRGEQYCSADYQAGLKRHSLHGSMSAKGCCYDHACAESFFHSLNVEGIHGERFADREMMQRTVFNYINCWRRHSACGGLSPEQFENEYLA